MKRSSSPRKRFLISLLIDVLLMALALVVFAFFHHVLPQRVGDEAVGRALATPEPVLMTAAPTDAVAAEPTSLTADEGETVPDDADEGLPGFTQRSTLYLADSYRSKDLGDAQGSANAPILNERFRSLFTAGEVIASDTGYVSGNVNITLLSELVDGSRVTVADIYVRDVTELRTVFADDSYGRNIVEKVPRMAERHSAILAINGDYYGVRSKGIVIRNGNLYRDTVKDDRDICILYRDGTMLCFSEEEFTEADMTYAWQGWEFGPGLLDEDGKALTDFKVITDIQGINPRTAIGYFEPGHYCFVTVDGRNDESRGYSLQQLSALMEQLGCRMAYNLDGGKSSILWFQGSIRNSPPGGGRETSDIIMITEEGE